MARVPNIDWSKTAVLLMDYRNDIIGTQPARKQNLPLDNAARVLPEARGKGVPGGGRGRGEAANGVLKGALPLTPTPQGEREVLPCCNGVTGRH